MIYQDRIEAARRLAPLLKKAERQKNALILAIPRGALELGAELKTLLKLPLDIIVTKKIGAPGNPEYAIGSVAPDGSVEINTGAADSLEVSHSYIDQEAERMRGEIRRRYEKYRGDPEPPSLKGKTIILVDDGIATGYTIRSAVRYIRNHHPKKIIVAVPVSSSDAARRLREEADEFICPEVREDFFAVGQFYRFFPQITDDEAISLLQQ